MTEKLTMELKALKELKQLGVEKLYDVSLENLIKYAAARRDGVQKLREAQEIFSKITEQRAEVGDNLLREANNAMAAAHAASISLIEARDGYGKSEQLKPAQTIANAQLREVELLQRSIELWWQRQISEQLHQARLRLDIQSTENSIHEAQEFIDKAKDLLQAWKPPQNSQPSKDTTIEDGDEMRSETQDKAEAEIKKVENLLQEREKALADVSRFEITFWLDEAEKNLPRSAQHADVQEGEAGGNSNDTLDSIYAALACLSRAKMLLDDLRNSSADELPQPDNELQVRYENLLQKAHNALRQGIGAERKRISDLIEKIKRGLEPPSSPESFLKDDANCKLVDELRYKLYLFPDAETPPEVQKVLILREENIRESYRILEQVKNDGANRGTHWACTELQEAIKMNPGAKGILDELGQWEEKKEDKNKSFDDLVSKISDAYDHVKDQHFQTLAETKENSIRQHKTALEELYKDEGYPQEWQQKFDDAQKRADWIIRVYSIALELQKLVADWKKEDKSVDTELLDRTMRLVDQLENAKWWPEGGKQSLCDAIVAKWAGAPGNELISNPLLIERIQSFVSELSCKDGGVA